MPPHTVTDLTPSSPRVPSRDSSLRRDDPPNVTRPPRSETPAVVDLTLDDSDDDMVDAGDADVPAPMCLPPWACASCTYLHVDDEASFLVCKICDAVRVLE